MTDQAGAPAATPGAQTTDAGIRAAVLQGLARIAPEIDPTTLRGDVALREQADLDSMDFLNLVIGISQSLGIDVPETDYPRLATLDGCVSYLAARRAGPP